MSEPHPSSPARPFVPMPTSSVGNRTGRVASPSSLDQRLIRRALLKLSKQSVPHSGDTTPSVPTSHGQKVSSMQMVLELFGHSAECARLARAGLVASCRCRLKGADDPAVVVGLAIHFARTALTHGMPLPGSVTERLARAVDAGDPACRTVAEWLEDLGLFELKSQTSAGEGGQ